MWIIWLYFYYHVELNLYIFLPANTHRMFNWIRVEMNFHIGFNADRLRILSVQDFNWKGYCVSIVDETISSVRRHRFLYCISVKYRNLQLNICTLSYNLTLECVWLKAQRKMVVLSRIWNKRIIFIYPKRPLPPKFRTKRLSTMRQRILVPPGGVCANYFTIFNDPGWSLLPEFICNLNPKSMLVVRNYAFNYLSFYLQFQNQSVELWFYN